MLTRLEIERFREVVWGYYRAHGRGGLLWRKTRGPYKVLVSEMMLQQTQVSRVVPKYKEFLKRFPSMKRLAQAPLSDVLRAWQGLGYNRRAKFLHLLAKEVVGKYGGKLPTSETELIKLPGIGKATASALLAFACNKPTTYLETNVRSVFLHHFFKDPLPNPPPEGEGRFRVGDAELLPLIAQAAAGQDPREWNWALLDYGSHIKSTQPNPSRLSKHYTRQSTFKGSQRQLRGQIVAHLATHKVLHVTIFKKTTLFSAKKVGQVLRDLVREGLIVKYKNGFRLSS